MKSARDLARDLATKADHDLRMAEIGLEHDAPLDTVAFHVQQTAEKALKALLASKELEYPRTHDVEALLDLAVPLYPELDGLREPLLVLSSYRRRDALRRRSRSGSRGSGQRATRGAATPFDGPAIARPRKALGSRRSRPSRLIHDVALRRCEQTWQKRQLREEVDHNLLIGS